jgi:N-acetylglucosamine malate deacetylase 2
MQRELPDVSSVLAICAHPDDESFGLGAVLAAFAARGTRVSLLCFTQGEASTLGNTGANLGALRARELAAAGDILGLQSAELLPYPDGGLSAIPLQELSEHVNRVARRVGADLLLVFDEGGITGHPDHVHATRAALGAGRHSQLPVIAWAVPHEVAHTLNLEFGAGFIGRPMTELDMVIDVDRARQRRAIACHVSQATDNPVLWRRLELLSDQEWLRFLVTPTRTGPATIAGTHVPA